MYNTTQHSTAQHNTQLTTDKEIWMDTANTNKYV